uniref:SANT domain-containing protein n=1 Tax=Steinernema glaseri TaxID=37863 RepID=A0A1I7ZVN0_9BILA
MELGKRKRRKAGGAKEDGKSKEKVKRAPYFTPAEDALLIQLFTTHKLEYEGEFDAASAGARGAKRSKTDFHVEWANEITALGGINRTPKMVHQRLRHLQKLSKDRLSAERNEIVATGGGLPAPRPQLTEAEAMLDEVNAGSHGISGFPGGFESGSIIESADDSSLQLEPDERTIQVPKGTQRDDEEVLLEDEEEDEPMKKLSVQQLRVRTIGHAKGGPRRRNETPRAEASQ